LEPEPTEEIEQAGFKRGHRRRRFDDPDLGDIGDQLVPVLTCLKAGEAQEPVLQGSREGVGPSLDLAVAGPACWYGVLVWPVDMACWYGEQVWVINGL